MSILYHLNDIYFESRSVTKKYNRWTNRETWLVNLWLSNDPGSYSLVEESREIGESIHEKCTWLEDQLMDAFNNFMPDPGLWPDIMTMSLSRVN